MPDNAQIHLGDSIDLALYHDGSDSFIKDTGTGALKVCSNLFRVNNAANDEAMIKAEENAGVTLSYDASTKFETMSTGARIQGGLLFNSDTAAANTLDDYETGTWTPALTSGFFSGATYTTQDGTYVKIGDQLTAWFYIRFNAMTTSGGEIRINSPFTMLTGTNHKGSGIVSYHDISNASSSHTLAIYQKSSSDLKFYAGTGTLFSATAHTSQAGKYLIGSFTVRTP